MSKTLNEHLFDQLDRLANADKETIDIETHKAASIISVSEQILQVARLKLDIIQAGATVQDKFSEIDVLPSSENFEDDKKKLQT